MRKTWTTALAVSLITLATLGWAGDVAAQQPPPPSNPPEEGAAPTGHGGHGRSIERRLDNLSQQLNLSPDQREKIRPLLRHEAERVREVRSNTSLSQDEAHKRIAMIRRNTNQHIAEFLSPDQKKQWQQMREERRGGGPQGGQHAPNGGGAPPQGEGAQVPQNPPAQN